MNLRRKLVPLGLAALLFGFGSVEARQPAKIPRLGFLFTLSPSISSERVEAFRQGLRDLGYFEGKNIVIEIRSAEGKAERLTDLADELVRLDVDVIITAGPTPTNAAKKATKTVPIVMTFDIDPVGSGLVASLARPGGNITGLATLAPELSGKQLELLKEIVPALSRIAVLESPGNSGNAPSLRETESAGRAFGVKIQQIDISHNDIESAFQTATNARADAILVLSSPSPHLSGKKLQRSPRRTDSRPYPTGQNLSKMAA